MDGPAQIPPLAGIVGIHQLLVKLSAAVTLAEVADVFLSQGRELVGADAAAVAMASEDGRSLSMLGIEGFEPAIVENYREFSAHAPTMMSDALASGESVFVEVEAEARSRYPHLSETSRALATAPARGRNGIIGVIAFRFPEGVRLDRGLRDLIATVGEHLGLTLDRAELFETAESERQRLEALMQQLPVGVAIAEAPSGRIIAVNDRATEIWRVPPFSEPINDVSVYTAFHPDGRRYTAHDWPIARSMATGEVIEAADVNVEFGDGTRGWVSISARPVGGRNGSVAGAVTTLIDVTDRRRREAEAHFIAEAADVLTESFDSEETLRRLAGLAVPRVADWCLVYIRERDGIRTVAAAHTDPEKVSIAREFAERYQTDPAGEGVGRVIRTGESQLLPIITRESIDAAAPDPEFTMIVWEELGIRSAVTVPLKARGECFGALRLVTAESRRRLDEQDLAFAEDLATHAALAVSNARLFAQQSEIAETLQRSLLPIKLPEIPGLAIATAFQPAGSGVLVGGDFYDVWQVGDDGEFGLAIGDVAGKGAPAAALTALARHTARTASLTLPTHSPAEVLRAVNDGILRRAGTGKLCTLATTYGAPIAEGGFNLITACAGHPPPLIVRVDGTVEAAAEPGTLLGFVPTIEPSEQLVHLGAGDTLFAWTDGLVEHRRNGELFGEERLTDVLVTHRHESVHDVIGSVQVAMRAFSPADPKDDIALIAARAL
jgi:PAS domain S-box-containing protein